VSEERVPLTPAEQMRRIRDAVHATDSASYKDAYAVLAAYFSRLDVLRGRIADLEGKMLIKESAFVSHAPVVSGLIVRFRSVWNWMSTKWYVLPLITQQNEYNMAVTQTLREVITSMESLAHLVQDMQMRVAELEAATSSSETEQD